MFNVLSSLDVIEGATVLDVFAGSGALGIESLSRGAESAVMVDASKDAVQATVVRGDSFSYLRALPPGRTFDLVFADPPYRFGEWAGLLPLLHSRAGLLVAETGFDRRADPWEPGPGWETVKVKRYGDTVVAIAQPAALPPARRVEEGES